MINRALTGKEKKRLADHQVSFSMCVSLEVKRLISLFAFSTTDRKQLLARVRREIRATHISVKIFNQPCTKCRKSFPSLTGLQRCAKINTYQQARLQSTAPQRRCWSSTKDQRELAGGSVIKWHLSVLRAVLDSVYWHPGLLWFSKCLVRM